MAKKSSDKPARYFRLYFDNAPAIALLSDAELGKVFRNVFRLGRDESLVPLKGKAAAIFEIYRAQFIRDTEDIDTNSENGKLGGRGRKKTAGLDEKSAGLDEKTPAKPPVKPTIQNNTVQDDTVTERDYTTQDNDKTIPASLVDYFASAGIPMVKLRWTQLWRYMYGPDGLTEDVIRYAVDACVAANARNWYYLQGVLNRLIANGTLTIDEIIAADEAREAAKQTGIFERPGSFDPKRGYE